MDPFFSWTSTGCPIQHVVKYTIRSREGLPRSPTLPPVAAPKPTLSIKKRDNPELKLS
uniref:Polyadenylate-binding protein-interacting protein 3-like isoform X1 n=1 Tax=Rhizophora mucronata TaxID=61149 RepID=A0A2P2MIZ2_RHIMU